MFMPHSNLRCQDKELPLSGMKSRAVSCIICVTCAFLCHATPQAPQIPSFKRLYVEPFKVKDGKTDLHQALISQLRKLKSISVVNDRSSADAVLTGNGEIWVKGYQSLNPRSGRLPSDGTPIYSGFVSVELKDAKGEILWSYLASPGAPSENISKSLADNLVKHLAKALAQPSENH
jgi:hypothetical protein